MGFQKPNFFLIGAPKCGTTSLAFWLSQHPNVFMSKRKEPHFFNTDGLQNITDIQDYESLFENTYSYHTVIGEASTQYLFSTEAVPNILNYNQRAKFLVCFRNPIEMAYSLHAQRLKEGRENIKSFEEAWNMQEQRKKGMHIPFAVKECPELLFYGDYCKLGEQYKRLRNYVGDDSKIYTVLLDDLRNEPQEVFRDILSFLDLKKDVNINFEKKNKSRTSVFPSLNVLMKNVAILKEKFGIEINLGLSEVIRKFNDKVQRRESLSEEFKDELKRYFETDIKMLENLLSRDLSKWFK